MSRVVVLVGYNVSKDSTVSRLGGPVIEDVIVTDSNLR